MKPRCLKCRFKSDVNIWLLVWPDCVLHAHRMMCIRQPNCECEYEMNNSAGREWNFESKRSPKRENKERKRKKRERVDSFCLLKRIIRINSIANLKYAFNKPNLFCTHNLYASDRIRWLIAHNFDIRPENERQTHTSSRKEP